MCIVIPEATVSPAPGSQMLLKSVLVARMMRPPRSSTKRRRAERFLVVEII